MSSHAARQQQIQRKSDVATNLIHQNMVLMKNMLRISISSIAFVRQLFQEDCFKQLPYGGFNIHQLECASVDENTGELIIRNNEAFTLTQWLERGIFPAIEKGYIDTINFSIFTKHPVTQKDLNLETYEFSIGYPSDTEASQSGGTINGMPLTSKEGLKAQAKRFVRSLVEFSGTLDELPPSRWITILIKYTDACPADYTPEFFSESNLFEIAKDGSKSHTVKMNIGAVKTSSMSLDCKFSGFEKLLMEDLRTAGITVPASQLSFPPISDDLPPVLPTPPPTTSILQSRATQHMVSNVLERQDRKTTTGLSTSSSTFRGSSSTNTLQANAKDEAGCGMREDDIVESDGGHEERKITAVTEGLTITRKHTVTTAKMDVVEEEEEGGGRDEKSYNEVKNLILHGESPKIATYVRKLKLQERDVKTIFQRLVQEGILEKKGRGFTLLAEVVPPSPMPADIIQDQAPGPTPQALYPPTRVPDAPKKKKWSELSEEEKEGKLLTAELGEEAGKSTDNEGFQPPTKRPRYSVIKKPIHLRKGINDGVSESYATPSNSQMDSSQSSQMQI